MDDGSTDPFKPAPDGPREPSGLTNGHPRALEREFAGKLALMGRENLEDFNTDFLIMLEMWEAAVKYAAHDSAQSTQTLEIAKFLGWVRVGEDGYVRAQPVVQACAFAMNGPNGYHNRQNRRSSGGCGLFTLTNSIKF